MDLCEEIYDVTSFALNRTYKDVVKPLADIYNKASNILDKIPTPVKIAAGLVGGAIAIGTGIAPAIVAGTMIKAAVSGAVISGAMYGVSSLFTGNFDKKEFVNSMLHGATDMFMISGVTLGVKGVVDSVVRNGGRIREAMLANEEGSTNAVDKLDDFYESRVRGKTSYGKSKQKTYQTYTKTNPQTGEVYSGRTSGYGNPAENIRRRDANHHMNRKGFDPAVLDKSSSDYNAIRGREQMLIEKFGGAKSDGGTSGNAINGIGKNNKKKDIYIKSAKKIFGDIK